VAYRSCADQQAEPIELDVNANHHRLDEKSRIDKNDRSDSILLVAAHHSGGDGVDVELDRLSLLVGNDDRYATRAVRFMVVLISGLIAALSSTV